MNAALLMLIALGANRHGEDTGGSELAALEVFPAAVHLQGARDLQRLLVLATSTDGTHADRTAEATFEVLDPSIARAEGNLLRPASDGATELLVRMAEREVRVPLSVSRAQADPPASFRLDVIPVLTASGCNAGSCHGAARGQDGFHLSLFGFDPAGDHARLTRELPGRRLDLAFPAASLLLEKPTAMVPHTGGRVLEPGSTDYATLRRWIEQGARDDDAQVAHATSIELYPPELVVGPSQQVRLVVRSRYSDGSDRDVTSLAVLRSSNPSSATLEEDGRLRSGAPGEAFITATFGVHAVGVPVVVLPADSSDDYADPAEDVWPANYVDELVESKLRKLRITPSELCDDEVFVRRVHLDIVGLLPTELEREQFLLDPDPQKRLRLVEELVERVEFSELWVMKWAELLGIRSIDNQVSEKAALQYFEWVRDSIAGNTPVDEMVRHILTASGGTFTEPVTNYYQLQKDTLILAENTAQAFLGVRIQCAQCHNHPFDRWTQDDYYGFAAFFAQVGRKRGEDYRERIVFDRREGEVKHPVDGRAMPPRFLGAEEAGEPDRDRRSLLAEWLTAPENPWFARNLANRVWAHLMGPGIIEPVDDLRVSNPPSNAPLLDALAERLVDTGYDLQSLVREICASRAYQRSSDPNELNARDERNYARAQVRRLQAETLLDIVCQVTEVPEKFKGMPIGARAVQIADGSTDTYFLRAFGRSPRETVCACEVSDAPSLSQALHLLNSEALQGKIVSGGVVARMLDAQLGADEAILSLYLRCLGRAPTETEGAQLSEVVAAADDPGQALEDVFWALINSREFLFQH